MVWRTSRMPSLPATCGEAVMPAADRVHALSESKHATAWDSHCGTTQV